jgi:type II restriction enzyme
MKNLKYYKKYDLLSSQDVFEYLMLTLKDSIFTWDYFTDFNKSIKHVKDIKDELSKLNSLIGLDEDKIDNAFIELIKSFPEVRKALPILIALRPNKFNDTPIIDDFQTLVSENKKDLFNYHIQLTSEISSNLLKFFSSSGIKKMLVNKEISNVIDYCIGVEVGMDTNARKNRTGTAMENLLEGYLKGFCDNSGLQYIRQATKKKILHEWNIEIEVDKIDRRFDFAILNRKNELFLIETNYYSGGGSKLKATAGEYKYLHEWLTRQEITFIWVTDGIGWNTARTALNETFTNNDYVINLRMISDGILEEIINR